ncbi:MAG: YihA family ribosome biogenesis GTP-binding protein, partial [Bacteroidaceae bacterium]
GYGYAKRGQKQREQLKQLIDNYILYRPQLTSLFVLVDSRHEPQKIDLEFITWLGENEIPFSIVFTKADKSASGQLNINIKRYLETLTEQWEELPPHFITSSVNRSGRDEILNYIQKINRSVKGN